MDTVASAPEGQVAAIPDDMVITLRKPVEHGGMTYTELSLKEPTAAQWGEWDGMKGVEADLMAVSVVSGIPRQAIAKIGARDLILASRYIARFLD
ncbi:phage tail assembly protein [Novosphingobium sp. BL-8A]|uniref:phage tail assembly protein n=1 Tax=Novosphingobium sp. BL-8A TaxID=3127639 RepID=UPI00375722E5